MSPVRITQPRKREQKDMSVDLPPVEAPKPKKKSNGGKQTPLMDAWQAASANWHPVYYVIGGRHRLVAAYHLGRRTLRVDVVKPTGARELRDIPIQQLQIDPDVQQGWTYREGRARKFVEKWRDQLSQPLTATEIEGGLTTAEKAAVRLAEDRDRRAVSALESFEDEVMVQNSDALAIKRAATETGWRIGFTGRGVVGVISAASALRRMHRMVGADGLRRALGLAAHWKDDPGGARSVWLEAFAYLVRDGYDEKLTSPKLRKMHEAVPNIVVRQVQGEYGREGGAEIARGIAERLRKKAGLKPLPARPSMDQIGRRNVGGRKALGNKS